MPECFYFQSAKNTKGVSEWVGEVQSLYLKWGGSETGQEGRQGSCGLQVSADLVGISLIHYFFSSGISFEACRDLEQYILNEGHLLHLCVLLNNACEWWKIVARASYLHLLTKWSQRPEEDLTLFVCSVCCPWQLWGNQHRTEALWTCLQQAATGLWPVNMQKHQRFHFNEKKWHYDFLVRRNNFLIKLNFYLVFRPLNGVGRILHLRLLYLQPAMAILIITMLLELREYFNYKHCP